VTRVLKSAARSAARGAWRRATGVPAHRPPIGVLAGALVAAATWSLAGCGVSEPYEPRGSTSSVPTTPIAAVTFEGFRGPGGMLLDAPESWAALVETEDLVVIGDAGSDAQAGGLGGDETLLVIARWAGDDAAAHAGGATAAEGSRTAVPGDIGDASVAGALSAYLEAGPTREGFAVVAQPHDLVVGRRDLQAAAAELEHDGGDGSGGMISPPMRRMVMALRGPDGERYIVDMAGEQMVWDELRPTLDAVLRSLKFESD